MKPKAVCVSGVFDPLPPLITRARARARDKGQSPLENDKIVEPSGLSPDFRLPPVYLPPGLEVKDSGRDQRRCRSCGWTLPRTAAAHHRLCSTCWEEQAQQSDRTLRREVAYLREEVERLRALVPAGTSSPPTMDADRIRRLLMLCHPDKHGGSALATEVTQWLLAEKARLESRR